MGHELRIGGLFEGYGGLTEGVKSVLGGSTAWYSEVDRGALKILAHRYPDVPNLGDITTVDWSQVEPVDVLTGGFPCQDVSAAGKRAGLRHGTRSGLWLEFARAIDALRPSVVVIENVRGLLSARGDEPTDAHLAAENAVRACKQMSKWIETRRVRALREGRTEDARRLAARRGRVMGCRKRAVARARWYERRLVRAIGTVLGSLADLGYDAQWHGLRAADVGAPHGRFRVFLVAHPSGDAGRIEHGDGAAPGDADQPRLEGHRLDGERAGERTAGASGGQPADLQGGLTRGLAASSMHVLRRPDQHRAPDADGTPSLLPRGGAPLFRTPTSQLAINGGSQHPDKRRAGGPGPTLADEVEHLLPTPRASDGTKGGPNQRGSSGDLMLPAAVHPSRLLPTPSVADGAGGHERRGGARGDELLLNGVAKAMALLPTPRASDGPDPSSHGRTWSTTDNNLHTVARNEQWGDYAGAIARWETVLGHPAPAPTMTSTKGNPQLSPRFVEWMMGLPAGWVTDVPGITRNEALRALGNGVVPQQCAAALRLMLGQAVAS